MLSLLGRFPTGPLPSWYGRRIDTRHGGHPVGH